MSALSSLDVLLSFFFFTFVFFTASSFTLALTRENMINCGHVVVCIVLLISGIESNMMYYIATKEQKLPSI